MKVDFGDIWVPDRLKKARANDKEESPKEGMKTKEEVNDCEDKEPLNTRVLLETKMIRSMMENHIRCPKCKCTVSVTFPSVGIASGCRLGCGDPLCEYKEVEKPMAANIPVLHQPLRVRSTDYQVNISYFLSFLASGDGGKEAEQTLGFLGLPNCTTMEKRTWPNIKRQLSPLIQELNDEILQENLTAAVKLCYGDRIALDGRKLFDLWVDQQKPENEGAVVLEPEEDYPQLAMSADMAWQKRSSGNCYDSTS